MTFDIRKAQCDKGKSAKSVRMASDINKEPKDRTKSRRTPKSGYKKRASK